MNFKFELEQLIWYMMDGTVHSAPVRTRMIIENAHDGWCSNEEQRQVWQRLGVSQETYVTVHGIVPGAAFATKQELLDSL